MEYELNALMSVVLVLTGVVAGFINVLAAGGSFLTIPALMLLGIPADVANATNRVGVFLLSVESVRRFNRNGALPRHALGPILLFTMSGGALGAIAASYLPNTVLKPAILTMLVGMAFVMVVKPSLFEVFPDSRDITPWQSRAGTLGLFLAGIYGGFIQAGVGFVLIAALSGLLRYDLVRANAIKMLTTACFTGVALVIFIVRDQILWVPGLLLALGSVIGAGLAVRFAIKVEQRTLRIFLLVVVVIVSLVVWIG